MLVGGLPNAPLLPEAHILCDLLLTYKRAKLDWKKTSRFYSDASGLKEFYRSISNTHIDDLMHLYGDPDFLVLKDPNYRNVLAEVSEIFPDAKCILSVRDPRDIVTSFIKIGERQKADNIESQYTKRNINFICKKIYSSYQPILCNDASATIVKYERLVTAPIETFRMIDAGLGLEIDLGRLRSLGWLEEEYRHQQTWVTALEGRPPVRTSVGSFESYLNNNELKKVETLCSEIMEHFEYQPAWDESLSDLPPKISTGSK
jgi:hypothetical protein